MNISYAAVSRLISSIPERFSTNELFDENKADTYVLRGVFMHKKQQKVDVAFFRRIEMKLDCLADLSHLNIEEVRKQIKEEVCPPYEWTKFSDGNVEHQGGWKEVTSYCFE